MISQQQQQQQQLEQSQLVSKGRDLKSSRQLLDSFSNSTPGQTQANSNQMFGTKSGNMVLLTPLKFSNYQLPVPVQRFSDLNKSYQLEQSIGNQGKNVLKNSVREMGNSAIHSPPQKSLYFSDFPQQMSILSKGDKHNADDEPSFNDIQQYILNKSRCEPITNSLIVPASTAAPLTNSKIIPRNPVNLGGLDLSIAQKRNQLLADYEYKYFHPQGENFLTNTVCIFREERGNYEGQTRNINDGSDLIFHGSGKLEGLNGNLYVGEFFRDLPHGKGLEISKDGQFYEGQFISGKKNGLGILHFPNGDEYHGQFQNDLMHGEEGHQIYTSKADNCVFKVPFKEGVKHGLGLREVSQKKVEQIMFKEGELQQIKLERVPSTHVFEETVQARKKTGKNTQPLIFPQQQIEMDARVEADTFVTQFRKEIYSEAAFTGQNIIKVDFPKGAFYEGPEEDEYEIMHSGKAIFTFPNKNVSAGEWKDGFLDGQGIYFDNQVGLYKGDFQTGLKHGYGVMNYLNGDLYEGSWKNDKKHGTDAVYTCFRKNTRIRGSAIDGTVIEEKRERIHPQIP